MAKLSLQPWLIGGLGIYVLVAVSSILRSLNDVAGLDFLLLAISWFAASLPYFFFGALAGHGVGLLLRKEKEQQDWAYYTMALLLTSVVFAAIFTTLPWYFVLFFPLAFGIFFVPAAIALVNPTHSMIFSTLLELAVIGISIAWLVFQRKRISSILLFCLFLIFFLGMSSCVRFA